MPQRPARRRRLLAAAGPTVLPLALSGGLQEAAFQRYRGQSARTAGFIGAGLTFSAVTNTCGMAMALAKLPYNRGASCDMGAVLDQLTATETSTRTGA